MRRLSLLALLIGIALVPLAYGLAANEHDRDVSQVRRALEAEADSHSGNLDAYFKRARSVILLTANQPAFRHFDEQPGPQLHKVRAGGRNLADVTAALAYLEHLYPTSIGETCFIDSSGTEAARVVRGRRAPLSDLSTEEEKAPFFAPTFALPTGSVYQAAPYVSPDTKEWVIANATPTPSKDGVKRSIVHFEVTIESFRRTIAGDEDNYELRVVDARTGRVVIDGDRPQRVGTPLGIQGDRRFVGIARNASDSGIAMVGGRQAAYRRVGRASGNANDWLLVATATNPTPSLLSSLGIAPLGMLALALLLVLLGAFGLRAQRRELESAADTDPLTGLRNRRRLLEDLERRTARASSAPAVLALFDLNGFKNYNDTFGHLAGDALLRRLSGRLQTAVASSGCAYRLGGDEFCVLADAENADELQRAAQAALREQGEGFDVTAAYGAVAIPSEAVTATEALRLADQRMYAAKLGTRSGPEHQSKDVLIRVLAERHPDLGDHLSGVAELADAVAKRLGLDEQECARVRHAAELHDIGKVAIPDSIVMKPGPLDDEEWAFVRRHTIIGERILGAAPSLAPVGELVRSSHERYDGRGYPDGLAGEEIPLGARIVAACDAFDAMLSDRPYSPPLSIDEARAELHRCSGTQFDPDVVSALVAELVTRRERFPVS
jgi:diguanylate cyclase (GGDEF)-like protein